jgi:hypothetical protein
VRARVTILLALSKRRYSSLVLLRDVKDLFLLGGGSDIMLHVQAPDGCDLATDKLDSIMFGLYGKFRLAEWRKVNSAYAMKKRSDSENFPKKSLKSLAGTLLYVVAARITDRDTTEVLKKFGTARNIR